MGSVDGNLARRSHQRMAHIDSHTTHARVFMFTICGCGRSLMGYEEFVDFDGNEASDIGGKGAVELPGKFEWHKIYLVKTSYCLTAFVVVVVFLCSLVPLCAHIVRFVFRTEPNCIPYIACPPERFVYYDNGQMRCRTMIGMRGWSWEEVRNYFDFLCYAAAQIVWVRVTCLCVLVCGNLCVVCGSLRICVTCWCWKWASEMVTNINSANFGRNHYWITIYLSLSLRQSRFSRESGRKKTNTISHIILWTRRYYMKGGAYGYWYRNTIVRIRNIHTQNDMYTLPQNA